MPKKILVVDTESRGLSDLAAFLAENGYQTVVLAGDDDPLDSFTSHLPELVFLNLEDPAAVSHCSEIRDNPDGAIVPMIFIGSGSESVTSPSDALTQGGDYFFAQPLDLPRVLAKVQTYVGVGDAAPTTPTSPPGRSPGPPPPPAPPPSSTPDSVQVAPATAAAPVPPPAPVSTPPTAFDESKSSSRNPDRTEELMADFPSLPEFGAPPTDSDVLAHAADDVLMAIATEEAANGRAESARREEEEERKRAVAEQRALRETAEEEARRLAEEEARRQAEEEARRLAEEEARRQAEEEARRQAEEETREKAEEEARRLAEEEAREKAEEEARRLAEEEARKKAEEEARRLAQEEARRQAEEEARKLAEEEARRQAEEEARRKAEEEARRQAEEEARRKAEEEARRLAEEEARRKAEEEARRKAEEEARRLAEEEARRKAQEEARRQAEEEARRLAQEEKWAREEEALREQIEEETRKRVEAEMRRRAEEVAERERKAAEEIARIEEEKRIRREEEAEARLRAEETAVAEALRREERAHRRAVEEEQRRLERNARNLPPEPAEPPEPEAWSEPAAPRRTDTASSMAPLTPLSPAGGDFGGSDDISRVLFAIWQQQVTGRVDFTHESRKRTVFFERGGPVDAFSSQVFDRMEEYLYREGKITRSQYQDVRVKGLKTPRRIGAHLVSEGFIKPHELFEAVRGHLCEVVLGIFEWEIGTYLYLPERAEENDRVVLDMDPRALIAEGVRRKYLMPRLMSLIGAPSSLLAPVPDASIDLDALGLRSDERQIVRLLDGTRSVEDLVFSTGLSAQRVYQVLAALVAVEYAEVRVRGIEGVVDDGTSASDTIDRQRIQEKLEHVRKLDYFQILGVPQVATPYEIDRAYERVMHDFQARRFSEPVRRELAEQLTEIEYVLDDARQILRDEALRDAYARHLS